MIDLAPFAGPVDAANPSGPNLEYHPDFQELERAHLGRPEQVIGNSVRPAEEPGWPDVCEKAQALLTRTRDLRVGVMLTDGLLHTEGLSGLSAGLGLLRRLLQDQWPTVHPQLDAEDSDDPTSRVNSLSSLVAADGLLKALRETPLVLSKSLGRFSLRDIRVASGKQPAPASMTDPPKQVQIDAAFLDADLETLKSSAERVTEALDDLGAIDRLLIEKLGGRAPELKPLTLDLTDIKNVLFAKLGARNVGPSGAVGTPDDVSVSPEAAAGNAGGGEIRSREDVVRQLDRLCDYYRKHEPSSPVPVLLRRAKRLVTMNFLEIIRDLTPGGMAEAELFGGIDAKLD